jgi:hypothetical protein
MVILSAIQPHRLLAAPPQPLPTYSCGEVGSDQEGSQHSMHYNMSLDDMRSQVGAEEERWVRGRREGEGESSGPGAANQPGWDALLDRTLAAANHWSNVLTP